LKNSELVMMHRFRNLLEKEESEEECEEDDDC
jgi:hypothetical protein